MGSHTSPSTPMNIAIVGAGIAGLGAAIALRRAGHYVEIYEKSQFKNEIGAAILITPNGHRILRRWGFNFDKARPVDFKQFRYVNASTLEIAKYESFEGVEERFGERMASYHRVDLHSGLREIATGEREGWTAPAKIHLGCEVVGVDSEKGVIELKGGEKISRDLVVIADGCHTAFIPQVAQEDIPVQMIGKSVYRMLAPFAKLREHSDASKLWDDEKPGFVTFFRNDLMIVTYPCRGEELLNVAIFHNTRLEERQKVDWNSSAELSKVLEVLEGCSELVKHIPQTTDVIKVYTVTQRPPALTIHRGKIICIGDSVHHMLPTHAQGGCSALEDAAALEVLLSLHPDSPKPFTHTASNLEKRLKLYQHLRLPRSAPTQILSSLSPQLTMAGLAKKTAELRKFYAGDLPPWPMGTGSWTEPLREFFYSYDVFAEAEDVLKAWDEETGWCEGMEGVAGEGIAGKNRWFGDVGRWAVEDLRDGNGVDREVAR